MQYLSLAQGAQKVLRLSQQMLAHAEQGNWELVSGLESERSRSLDSLFSHPDIKRSLSEIADILFEVISLDKQCMQLGESARNNMVKQLQKQSHGGHAVNSYLKNTHNA
jgi:hypothetical protein